MCQKDTEARWTKKHNKYHYVYKNHISIDNLQKLIRRYHATDAAVHDSRLLAELIDPTNRNATHWAGSAYRTHDIDCDLKLKGYRSRIHHKGKPGEVLSEYKQAINQHRSAIRARIEHVFVNQ